MSAVFSVILDVRCVSSTYAILNSVENYDNIALHARYTNEIYVYTIIL
jgi:hypothetical protein